jgi:hypothetical protein
MPLLSNKAALLEIKEGLFVWKHSSFYKGLKLYVSNKKETVPEGIVSFFLS